jgi:hypothetical protein
MTPEEQARFLDKKPEEMLFLLGPAPAGISSAEREQALKELLSGQTPAERLPLCATDRDAAYDPAQYASLTTELDTLPISVEVRIGPATLLSGALAQEPANRMTAATRASIRACYRRELARDEDLPPKSHFDVVLLVNAQGEVGLATIEGKPKPGLSTFLDCVKARMRAMYFDPAPGKPSRLRFSVDVSSTKPD